jgi:WD40 repeat protein
VVVTPEGKRFVPRGNIVVIAIESAQVKPQPTSELEPSELVESIAWSPDGSRIACANRDGVINLWKGKEGRFSDPPVVIGSHPGIASSVDFGPEGKWFISCDSEGRIVLWDVVQGNEHTAWRWPGRVWTAKFAPDGRHIAVGDGSGVVSILRTSVLPR